MVRVKEQRSTIQILFHARQGRKYHLMFLRLLRELNSNCGKKVRCEYGGEYTSSYPAAWSARMPINNPIDCAVATTILPTTNIASENK